MNGDASMGDNLGRCAEQHNKLWQQRQADKRRKEPHDKRRKEPYRGHDAGIGIVASTKGTRDMVAGTMTEEEPHGLNESHVGKGNADTRSGLGREPADESGVHHIVQCRHHHADHRRNSKAEHQSGHWCFGHFAALAIQIGHGEIEN